MYSKINDMYLILSIWSLISRGFGDLRIALFFITHMADFVFVELQRICKLYVVHNHSVENIELELLSIHDGKALKKLK